MDDGVGGSSACGSRVFVLPGECDDVGVREWDSAGVSRNGSLGARARFGVAVVVDAMALCFSDGSG